MTAERDKDGAICVRSVCLHPVSDRRYFFCILKYDILCSILKYDFEAGYFDKSLK